MKLYCTIAEAAELTGLSYEAIQGYVKRSFNPLPHRNVSRKDSKKEKLMIEVAAITPWLRETQNGKVKSYITEVTIEEAIKSAVKELELAK